MGKKNNKKKGVPFFVFGIIFILPIGVYFSVSQVTVQHFLTQGSLSVVGKPIVAMQQHIQGMIIPSKTVAANNSSKDENSQDTILKQQNEIAELKKQLDQQKSHQSDTPLANDPSLASHTPLNLARSAMVSSSVPEASPSPSPHDQQTAIYWSNMDAANVAQIVEKLDPHEVARIFLAMKSDQVAEILDALPTSYNLKLQELR